MFSKKFNIFGFKCAILVLTIVTLVCLFFYVYAVKNDVDDCNLVKEDLSLYYGICGKIACQATGDISIIGCGRYQCEEGKDQIGYKEDDNSKPYPECCGSPICHR